MCEMLLPEKRYYFIDDAAKKLDCSIRDILQYAADGIIQLGVYLSDYPCNIILSDPYENIEDARVTGIVYIRKCDIEEFLHEVNFEFFSSARVSASQFIEPDEDATMMAWECSRITFDDKVKDYANLRMYVRNLNFDARKLIVKEFPIPTLKEMNFEFKDIPKELRVAIEVFEEFWQDRPQELNPAPEHLINQFIRERMGKKVSSAALDRIRTIARPDHEKGGGAPRSDAKHYRGRSQQNLSA